MKKILLTAALVFAFGATQAQIAGAGKTPDEKAAQKMNLLIKKYELTEAQQARLKPELVKTELTIAQKQQAAQEAKQQLDQSKKAQETVILEVMTPEQQARFEADKILRKERMKAEGKQHRHKMGLHKHE